MPKEQQTPEQTIKDMLERKSVQELKDDGNMPDYIIGDRTIEVTFKEGFNKAMDYAISLIPNIVKVVREHGRKTAIGDCIKIADEHYKRCSSIAKEERPEPTTALLHLLNSLQALKEPKE
jgi:hypothetical protein